MKIIIGQIFSILLLACMSGFVSCTNEGLPTDGKKLLVIHLDIVSASRAGNSTPTEFVDNLRIIMIDDDADTIEVNELVTFDIPGGFPAANFPYDFTCTTNSGYKKFYFIANEDRVSSIMYDNGITGLPINLTDLLDSYEVGSSEIKQLQNTLNSVYYSPQFNVDGNGGIYLPYSSTYDNIFISEIPEDGDGLRTTVEMFLIPAATKFSFNFTNFRDYGVEVNEISLQSVNQSNYLFAQVGATDQSKTLPESDEPLYWVDWLAEVSKLSQQNSGYYPNMNFNDKYGWITDYSLPNETTSNIPQNYIFVSAEETFTINGLLDGGTGEAGVYTAGPFYVPESKNFLNPETNTQSTEQQYYLTIGLNDLADRKQAPDFTNVNIPNLKALFRNTNVIINVKMEQGYVAVYAQIAPWNQKSINGWVTEGGAPNPNPFGLSSAVKIISE